MGVSLEEKLSQLSPERRQWVEQESDRMIAEYHTLQSLRKAKDLTQVELAKSLGVNQAAIAKLEQRTDVLLSTLRGYVEAMGGKLNLTVEFPDQVPVSLSGLGDSDELTS